LVPAEFIFISHFAKDALWDLEVVFVRAEMYVSQEVYGVFQGTMKETMATMVLTDYFSNMAIWSI
jgi:hypothetical protein